MNSEREPTRTRRESSFSDAMLAAVDIGNTNIVLALRDNGKWISTFRVFTDAKKTGDEYYAIFSSLLRETGIDCTLVDKAIISSVVPFLTRSIEKNMERLFGIKPLIVSKELETGLDKSSIPEELGSDLLCNLAYSHSLYPDKNAMTVDFGTALTFSTVSREGKVLGVAIAPGLITAVNALFGSTAKLPQVELKVPDSVLGRNTEDSVRSGIMHGFSGLVNEMIRKTEEEIGEDITVIATGGLSATISSLIPRIDRIDGLHTLKGLALISDLN